VPARARRAAVACGNPAATPPIPHIRMRGFSDLLMPVSAGISSRASLAFPVRTSAWLARKVTPRTTLMPTLFREKPFAIVNSTGFSDVTGSGGEKGVRVPLEAALERNGAGASLGLLPANIVGREYGQSLFAVTWRPTQGKLGVDLRWVSDGALTRRLGKAHTVGAW